MKTFLIQIITFGALLGLSDVGVFSMADGSTDAMYLKFSTPQQSSLILGTSREAQGIKPEYLHQILDRDDVFNYAFQLPSSPYGEVYLNSISKKLKPNSKSGFFILDVNPWTLSIKINSKTRLETFSEEDNFQENTNFDNRNPNIEYLVESFVSSYKQIIINKYRKGNYQTVFVEDDGWLNITLEEDANSREIRTQDKILNYHNKLKQIEGISDYRMAYLIKTIKYLQGYGQIYLVRIPVIQDMLDIENDLMPDFNKQLDQLSEAFAEPYINMMTFNSKYTFTDGNQLDVRSGQQFSQDLANIIIEFQE
ncbi:MAG: hypothetical protein HKN51_12280 [Saprospiraceae bacterium]|nr:hypothetical protein [Flavobacteriaceae bacterium]NNE15751.1 hypothetical protein [Saprospiraceae bacterium]